MNKKNIYIFIGPKGSGKTYLGALLQKELGIQNLNAESIFKSLQPMGITSGENIIAAYKKIEEAIDIYMQDSEALTFESTGIADEFWLLYERLKNKYNIKIISVYAPEKLCIERIKLRNAEEHIAIDEATVRRIYLLCCGLEYKTDLRVFTANLNVGKFIEEFKLLTNKKLQ